MLVRLLALLIALGLLAGTVQASDLDTGVGVALVDEAEDSSELEVIAVPAAFSDSDRTIDALAATMQPPHYQHFLFVFRPPRAPAFN